MVLQFRWAARSHVGHVRANNEDSGFAGAYLIMVADGVGGAAAGEVASASVTYVTAASSMIAVGSDPVAVLRDALDASYRHLQQGVINDERRSGMATTLTAILTDGTRFGDGGTCRGFARLPDAGSPAEADHAGPHPRANARRRQPDLRR